MSKQWAGYSALINLLRVRAQSPSRFFFVCAGCPLSCGPSFKSLWVHLKPKWTVKGFVLRMIKISMDVMMNQPTLMFRFRAHCLLVMMGWRSNYQRPEGKVVDGWLLCFYGPIKKISSPATIKIVKIPVNHNYKRTNYHSKDERQEKYLTVKYARRTWAFMLGPRNVQKLLHSEFPMAPKQEFPHSAGTWKPLNEITVVGNLELEHKGLMARPIQDTGRRGRNWGSVNEVRPLDQQFRLQTNLATVPRISSGSLSQICSSNN